MKTEHDLSRSETQEWFDALRSMRAVHDPERTNYLLRKLVDETRGASDLISEICLVVTKGRSGSYAVHLYLPDVIGLHAGATPTACMRRSVVVHH